MTSFEIWNSRNMPLMTFDQEHRAREEFKQRRIPNAKLVKVTRVVEELEHG